MDPKARFIDILSAAKYKDDGELIHAVADLLNFLLRGSAFAQCGEPTIKSLETIYSRLIVVADKIEDLGGQEQN